MSDHSDLRAAALAALTAGRGPWGGAYDWPTTHQNARFIAVASPARILALLDELAALKTERDDLRERLHVADADIRELEVK